MIDLVKTLEQAAVARPGYELASFKDAGLPVYLLTIRIMTLERKALAPIDEAVLRSIDAGIDDPLDLVAFLGLTSSVVTPVLAGLNTNELINYRRGVGESRPVITVTIKGQNALAEAKTVTPQEKMVKVTFDALTKQLLFIAPAALYKPRDMRDLGLFEVPIAAAKRPEVEDIPLHDFDRILSRQKVHGEAKRELLSLRRIERRELHYLPCVMLFYRNLVEKQEVDVAFWREDGPSLGHEARFRELGGPDAVGARLLCNGTAEPTSDLLARVSEYAAQAPDLDAPSSAVSFRSTPAQTGPIDVVVTTTGETLQSILCHEHPALLKKALLTSRTRLLIISPWIRHHVVDWQFVASLEALLKKDVAVYIGYGLDEGDAGGKPDAARQKLGITPQAEKDLKQLASKYKNFRFVYVGNTHRKILVSDDFFAVVTSFNWLSFKGDAKHRPRDESGIVIRKTAYVEQQFRGALALLEQGYAGRPLHLPGESASEPAVVGSAK